MPEPASIPDAAVLVPSSTTWARSIDDQVVVVDRGTQMSHVLNTSAALVLTLIDGTRSVGQVLDQLERETGVDRSVLAVGVEAALQSFLARGMVHWVNDGPVAGVSSGADPTASSVERLLPVSRTGRWAGTIAGCLARIDAVSTGPLALAGSSAEIHTDDAGLARVFAAATAALPRSATATTAVWVLDRGPDHPHRFRLVIDDAFAGWAPNADAAADKVFLLLNLLAIANTPDRVLLHAGAAERDGRAVVVAGASGHGKSTLTAALVQSGFAYLTDELVVIDPATRRVDPYPKALDLSAGSLDLLGLEPDAADSAMAWDKHKVAPTRLGAVSAGADLALLVLLAPSPHDAADADHPQVGASDRTEAEEMAGGSSGPVEELGPVDALVELLPSTFAETYDLPHPLDALADLCVRTPAIRVHRMPPADAVAAIVQALDRSS